MGTTREQAMSALYALFQTLAPTPFVYVNRRLKLWPKVPAEQQPALFLLARDPETSQHVGKGIPRKLIVEASAIIYARSPADTEQSGSPLLHSLIEAVEGVLKADPSGIAQSMGVNTLGGLVNRCWIEGSILKAVGDLEGQMAAKVPIKILFP